MDAQSQKSSEPLIVNRPASVVMKLARMGSFHQSRLSFMRVLLRRLKAENWQFRKADDVCGQQWRVLRSGQDLQPSSKLPMDFPLHPHPPNTMLKRFAHQDAEGKKKYHKRIGHI